MTATRPLIGVTCCHRRSGGEEIQSVIDRYAFAAMRWADAAALLVPAAPDLMTAREAAARLDGLMLTGSPSNIAAERYGEGPAPEAGPFDPARDTMALGLIDAMIERGRPIFAVCRGFQEVNVAFGGTLSRNVNADPAGTAHHAPQGTNLEALFAHSHEVVLTPDGVLSEGLGRERLTVNSVHFQGVARLGSGLTIEAKAPDGLIEALSARVNGAQVLAVQWHPEWQTEADPDSQRLFAMVGRALRGESMSTVATPMNERRFS